jgi:hypothetical protein
MPKIRTNGTTQLLPVAARHRIPVDNSPPLKLNGRRTHAMRKWLQHAKYHGPVENRRNMQQELHCISAISETHSNRPRKFKLRKVIKSELQPDDQPIRTCPTISVTERCTNSDGDPK